MKNPIKWERGENVVKLFPTLVVDNFLSDPDYVYNLAKDAVACSNLLQRVNTSPARPY